MTNKAKNHLLLSVVGGLSSLFVSQLAFAAGEQSPSQRIERVAQQSARAAHQQPTPPKQQTIMGKVLDEAGEPLAGARLTVISTKRGTVADANGKFTLHNVPVGATIEVTFVGYATQRITAKSGVTNYTIKLKSKSHQTNEVTVIGYGERNERTIVGSVAKVKGDDIKEIPSASVENLLQGRMAGVEVTNSSGAPGGGGAIIAIRGYNSMIDQSNLRMSDYGEPLYVIDGVPVQGFTSPVTGTNTLSSIDPTTIESIEVLKDAASAAIYGSRAGRGVILITTKKGKEGKAKFSANVSYSLSQLPAAPVQTGGKAVRHYLYKAMENTLRPYEDPSTGITRFPRNMVEGYLNANNGAVYNGFWSEAVRGYRYNPQQPNIADAVRDSLNPVYNNSTNWYEYAFRPASVINANIQASGGTQTVSYLIGAGAYHEKGIAKGTDFSRFNFITNLNVNPVKNLMVDARISMSYMGRKRGGDTGGSKIEYLSVDPRKASSLAPAGGEILDAMLAVINKTSDRTENYDLRGSLALDYKILPGLSFKSNASAHMTLEAANVYQPAAIAEEKINTTQSQASRRLNVTNENLLTFNRSFAEIHNVEVLLGQSFEHNAYNILEGVGYGSASDKIHYIYKDFPQLPPVGMNTRLKIMQGVYSDRLEQALISSFGRLAYNYKMRYLIEATVRRDGSSVFGSNNKWATFPSVAVGWTFSEEQFMRRAWWLNQGKLRFSWGRSGETYPDPYKAHGLLLPAGDYYGRPMVAPDNTLFGGMINRSLRWVLHSQYDMGIDLAFFDYALKVKLDYYLRKSDGILSGASLPKTIYLYSHKVMNANNALNEGVELELQADIFRPETPDGFSWRTRFNISHNRNALLSTFNSKDVGLSTNIPYHMLGRPLYMMYTFVDGPIFGNEESIPYVYDKQGNKLIHYLARKQYPFAPGMRDIVNLNGDNRTDVLDQLYQGTTLPKATGGWSNEFRYKNFDLTTLFTFVISRKIINQAKWESLSPKNAASKPLMADLSKLKFWEKEGDENVPGMLPMLSNWDDTMLQYYPIVNSNIEDVSYLKLKTITLGYNLPSAAAKKLNLSGLRFFLTGENLLTITNYSGLDPEVVPFMGTADVAGRDQYRAYPLARKVTLGMTINL